MRFSPAVLVLAVTLAATFCLCAAPRASLAQEASGAVKAPQAVPQDADELARAAVSGLPDDDTPPPFVRRPKLPPQPQRPDLTYAQRPAPRDFRGLRWGVPLAEAKVQAGLAPVTEPRPLPDTYFRPGEELRFGPAEVKTVAYYFRKGIFVGAGVVFAGEANFFLVKDHLIGLYGPGRQIGGRYGWTWNNVNIDLRMHDGMGELRYTHEP